MARPGRAGVARVAEPGSAGCHGRHACEGAGRGTPRVDRRRGGAPPGLTSTPGAAPDAFPALIDLAGVDCNSCYTGAPSGDHSLRPSGLETRRLGTSSGGALPRPGRVASARRGRQRPSPWLPGPSQWRRRVRRQRRHREERVRREDLSARVDVKEADSPVVASPPAVAPVPRHCSAAPIRLARSGHLVGPRLGDRSSIDGPLELRVSGASSQVRMLVLLPVRRPTSVWRAGSTTRTAGAESRC